VPGKTRFVIDLRFNGKFNSTTISVFYPNGASCSVVSMSVDWLIEKSVQQSEPSLEKLAIQCDRRFGIA
jgi:hypothetical protein